MNRTSVIAYQLIAGSLEGCIGAALACLPQGQYGSRLLAAFHGAPPFIVLIGMFTFTLGLTSLLAGFFLHRGDSLDRIQAIWLVSALIHFGTAIILAVQIAIGALPFACAFFAAACGVHFVMQSAFLFWRRTPSNRVLHLDELLDYEVSNHRSEWQRWIH